MREIKFRAWDTSQKRFLTVRELYDSGELNEQFTFNPERSDSVRLMQYTGLKDKNGKEIYEGDILEKLGVRAEVKFSHGAFVANWDNTAHNQVLYYWDDKGFKPEVIGNIYEHGHLLK